MSSIALISGYLALFSAFVILIVNLVLIKKYREKKRTSTLYLILSIFGWMGAILSAMIIYWIAGFNLDVAIFFQKLVYAFVFGATILTFLFASKVFFEPKKLLVYIYIAIGATMVLLMLIDDSVEITTFPDGSGYPLLTIDLLYSLLIVVYVVPTVLGICVVAIRLSRKVEGLEKLAFKIIGIGQIMLLLTFVIDTLATVFIDDLGLYSMFLYLTWIAPMIASIFYYLGWTLPMWFKKAIKATE